MGHTRLGLIGSGGAYPSLHARPAASVSSVQLAPHLGIIQITRDLPDVRPLKGDPPLPMSSLTVPQPPATTSHQPAQGAGRVSALVPAPRLAGVCFAAGPLGSIVHVRIPWRDCPAARDSLTRTIAAFESILSVCASPPVRLGPSFTFGSFGVTALQQEIRSRER